MSKITDSIETIASLGLGVFWIGTVAALFSISEISLDTKAISASILASALLIERRISISTR